MEFVTGVSLIFSGLAFLLALGFLITLVVLNEWSQAVQAFSILLLSTIAWNISTFITEFDLHFLGNVRHRDFVLKDLGYAITIVSAYSYISSLAGVEAGRLRIVGALAIFGIITQHMLRIVNNNTLSTPSEITSITELIRVVIFAVFGGVALYRVGTYQDAINSRLTTIGFVCILCSFSITFFQSVLSSHLVTNGLGSAGILLLGFGLLNREVIRPFHLQGKYVRSIQRVTLAITSQIALNMVLDEVATQIIRWVKADGVAIFLHKKEDKKCLEIVTAHNLPKQLVGLELGYGQGVAGTVALLQQSIFVEDYEAWQGGLDFPLAREFLGSVIGTPLIYAHEVIGVLLVISSAKSTRFRAQDLNLLELLGSQAAVAITHSRLFDQIIEAREQLEVVLASTESPVVAIDNTGSLIFANLAARSILDLASDDHLLRSDFFPESWEAVVRDIDVSGDYTYETKISGRDFLCHIGLLGGIRQIGWVIIFNDVTELKELDRMKSEMVRMVSHDLKNPLMGALAYTDLLQDDVASGELDRSTLMQGLVVVEKQLQRMDRIIRGVLDIERIRLKADQFELLSVRSVVDSALEEVETFAWEREIRLEKEIDDERSGFLGNAEQFRRALVNLVENAIKFSQPGGKVLLGVRSTKENRLVFCVEDEGIGIPPELHERIFDRFFRGEQPGIEHVSGSGLGLSLVKTIVEQHGGRIWVESEMNQGTRMFIELDLSKAPREK